MTGQNINSVLSFLYSCSGNNSVKYYFTLFKNLPHSTNRVLPSRVEESQLNQAYV
ncbi:hypothetical protein DSECCO2_597790 [anaerobic digester metagenome]